MTISKVDSIAELNFAWHKINWPYRHSVVAFCTTVLKVDPPSTISNHCHKSTHQCEMDGADVAGARD